jgi:hypothetical protein
MLALPEMLIFDVEVFQSIAAAAGMLNWNRLCRHTIGNKWQVRVFILHSLGSTVVAHATTLPTHVLHYGVVSDLQFTRTNVYSSKQGP